MSQWRIRVGYGVQCRRPKLDIPLLIQVTALLVVMVELCRISQVTVGNESHVYC